MRECRRISTQRGSSRCVVWIFWLKTWRQHRRFKSNQTAVHSKCLDNNTWEVWRHVFVIFLNIGYHRCPEQLCGWLKNVSRTYIQTEVSRKWVKYQFEWTIPLTKVRPTACMWEHWSGAHVLFVYNGLCLCVCSYIDVLLVPKEGTERRGRRWEEEEEEEEEGKEQRQSGIIVTDRAAPWWAMRCIVCHLTNLNQSIISPSSTSAINQAGAAPAEGPAAPCCLFQVTQANQDS